MSFCCRSALNGAEPGSGALVGREPEPARRGATNPAKAATAERTRITFIRARSVPVRGRRPRARPPRPDDEDEGNVGDGHLAVPDSPGRSRLDGLERLRDTEVTALAEILIVGKGLAPRG